jgi:hypothetical protein
MLRFYKHFTISDLYPLHFPLAAKALSDTRWSATVDATRSVFAHYLEIVKAV